MSYAGIVPDDARERQTVNGHLRYWTTDAALSSPMHTWVSDAGGVAVAYAHFGPYRPMEDEPPGAGELWGMYVDPDFARQGHGSRLMDVVIEELISDGYPIAFLWVLEGNVTARRFYEATGWAADGTTRQVDLGQPLDEVRYRHPLSTQSPMPDS